MNAELLIELGNKAIADKKGLVLLKNAAVRLQQFELAAQLRAFEIKNFPESQETKEAKDIAVHLVSLFSLVGFTLTPKNAWLITETVKRYGKRKGNFDLKDATTLRAKAEEHFGE